MGAATVPATVTGGAQALLSIVVPCFNRHEMIVDCLRSIDPADRAQVQVVLVDDGSEPPLDAVVGPWLRDGDRSLRQSNGGRAVALRAGILAATGQFVMVMDSDDEFIAGRLDTVLADLRVAPSPGQVGLVYECREFDLDRPISRLPDGLLLTLLGVRADLRVAGDLKEVVSTPVVQACLYPDPRPERRVPTSYVWAGVAARGTVRTRALAVVRHRYLDNGMSKTIGQLKAANPYWLARAHWKAAVAPPGTYRSRRFRIAKAIKALAIRDARLDGAELAALRSALGGPLFRFCQLAASLVRMGGAT